MCIRDRSAAKSKLSFLGKVAETRQEQLSEVTQQMENTQRTEASLAHWIDKIQCDISDLHKAVAEDSKRPPARAEPKLSPHSTVNDERRRVLAQVTSEIQANEEAEFQSERQRNSHAYIR
eukprot:TRINITY_DN36342_c0_g1_i3.p1 TRINITY_DN36342_c0_g1~~TRINITY_DN36342_c0_g1_i3.p1  ORF type:complete len:120 (+),score=32.82 TRINITY_DN36342_c0_g1_i3:79-438(+)